MQAVYDALERAPVATISHLLVVVVLGLYLLIHGNLPHDVQVFAGIATVGNVGVAGSRAHLQGKKATVASVAAATASTPLTVFDEVHLHSAPVGDAPDEPGDADALPHISTTTDPIPADQGDAGGVA